MAEASRRVSCAPCPGSPAPLGLSQPLRPGRLFYSPGLMRAFNFSFTTGVTPTFNNTPCARQKFAPGNHGFDHKTTAGRRSWLTLSALQAVWRQRSWKSDGVSPRPEAADWEVLVPSPPWVAALQGFGEGEDSGRGGGPGCGPGEVVAGNAGGPRSLPSPFGGPTMCSSLPLRTLISSRGNVK